jgi:flagellar rod assembly protein/muramidase FlgJ
MVSGSGAVRAPGRAGEAISAARSDAHPPQTLLLQTPYPHVKRHASRLRFTGERASRSLGAIEPISTTVGAPLDDAPACRKDDMTPEAFIARLGPLALVSARSSGVPASFIVAQAALESGWGESRLAREANNLFGIKAGTSWNGDTLTLDSREFIDGQWLSQGASWRRYADWQDSIDDHAAFLRGNPRYAACFEHTDGVGFAGAVARAGYATDPNYASKLSAIIERYGLAPLDTA